MHRTAQTLAACSLTTLLGSPLMAQDARTDTAPEDRGEDAAAASEEIQRPGRPGVTLSLNPRASFAADRDFDTGVGSIESTTFGGALEIGIPQGERGRLNLSVSFDTTNIDVTQTAAGLVGTNAASVSAQFDSINELGFQALYFRPIGDEGTTMFVGGGVGFATEGGADYDDSFIWNALGGFSFQVSENLRLGAGIGVFAQLEDGVRVVPIPQITLKIDERWTLASERAGLKLDYKANDTTSFGVFGRFEGRDFRIDTDNTLLPGGAVASTGFPITAYVDFKNIASNPNVSLFAEVGVIAGGEMEFFNAAGVTVIEEDIDAGVFASLSLRIRF